MDTEALAVAAVKAAIAKTDYLVDYSKDKEPIWDGSIYAYSSKKKRNVDWVGKAPVQVKGKNIDTLDVIEIKYDIEVVDLKNYKKDGGLIFFVVGIDSNGDTKIFYKKAYDQTKQSEYLEEATRLAEWLKNANCLEGLSTINYLQCIARQSELSSEQETELMELLEKYSDNEQMKAGIHILLGNYKMAKLCLDKLDVDKRAEFCELPIYTLMK